MSSFQNAPSIEVGSTHQNDILATASLSRRGESPLKIEGDEEEDEDVDFNPFLKETPSQEASSSLSSDIDGLDVDDVDSGGRKSVSVDCNMSISIAGGNEKNCAIGDSQHVEGEIVLRGMAYPGEACEKDLGEIVPGKPENATLALTPQPDIGIVCERKSGVSSQPDAIQDGSNKLRESNNTTGSQKLIMDFDDSDAICMRTRARYSLASFTLDELETFLQETDDDDDFQNVDDQEEYRKFLAAVLQGVDGDSKTIQECGNVDDEDEDNDADFQVEIEEALESDLDENIRSKTYKEGYEAAVRRPETRQNRRQKAAAVKQKRVLEEKRPLRPLLPFMRNAPIASFPNLAGNHLVPEPAPQCQSSTAFDGFPNGFTPHQLGQLHCLIHEHVQLLIQVFSICVLDPSRQLIASQIQGLISEMLHQRDHMLAWRSMPYPSFCFHPPYVHPSIPDELPKICPTHFTSESPLSSCAQQGFSLVNNKMPPSANVSPSKIIDECNSNGQEGTFWVPYTGYPILSVLDVAPLSFVGKYMDDVSKAKEEHRKRHLDGTSDILFEKEPLFPVRNLPSFSEANSECVRGPISPATNIGPSSSPSSQPPKKTMAAALVESTKKQSVAPVPKEIVKLVQRFLPLFNPSLYPYKPPPVPVAKRVLFTDAEDELLALGMMEYNTDWKAIQQRLLPCKSKHQIFVRQKNRCSSKAPDNPIKAVRRLKTSPLTAEEIARIHEGLKAFKLDWMSIWKFIVPYRDPSLLPRQWRIALGTQKSYKIDPAKKEKRRLYEFKRRHKAAASPGGQTASENEGNQIENDGGETNSGDDCVDNDDEAYVHEAFLSDWRPNTNSLVSSGCPSSNLKKQSQPNVSVPQEHTHLGEQRNTNSCGGSQPQNGQMHEFLGATNSHKMHTFSHLSNVSHCTSYAMELNHRVTKLALKSSKSQCFPQPYRAHKHKHAHLVKLAPDLPPVNLPQSVRVISQSAFKSYRFGSSAKNAAAAGISSAATTESMVARLSHGAESGNNQSTNVGRDRNNALKYDIANLHHQELGVGGKCVGEERGTDSDLQMHPLLFQAPEDGCFSYYRVNCGTVASTSFGFSPGNQPQLNLSLFHDSQQENRAVICSSEPLKSKEATSTSGGIDFHPLLQQADDVIGVSANGGRPPQASVDMDSLRDKHTNVETHSDIVPSESQANDGQKAASDKLSSADGKANELDLEIHLSSNTSTMKKATGSKNVTRHIQNSSSEGAFDRKIRMETQDGSPNNDGENYPLASVPNQMSGDREHVARGSVMSIPSDSISKYSIDNMNDQSLPGIVMEQEELSDSDEETGEYVEFECEEMADSEGEEGSDCEQAANIRNQEATSVVFDKVATNADEDPQQGEPTIYGNNVSNFHFSPECSVSRLGSTGQGEDASTAVCLSLKTNSRSWHPIQDSKHVEGRNKDHSADRIIAQSASKRSRKKTMPTNPSRKSRKRARALTVESSSGE